VGGKGAVVIGDNGRCRGVEPSADAVWGLADRRRADLRLLRDQGGQGMGFPKRERSGFQGVRAVVMACCARLSICLLGFKRASGFTGVDREGV
jgi:hypothetical protein